MQDTSTQNEVKKSASLSLKEKVNDYIASSNQAIFDIVFKKMAQVEIEARADAVLSAIASLKRLQIDICKIRPDLVSYSIEGAVTSSAWSKSKLEERKKCEEKIAKIEKAITSASNNDFSAVYDLLNSNDKPAVKEASVGLEKA